MALTPDGRVEKLEYSLYLRYNGRKSVRVQVPPCPENYYQDFRKIFVMVLLQESEESVSGGTVYAQSSRDCGGIPMQVRVLRYAQNYYQDFNKIFVIALPYYNMPKNSLNKYSVYLLG